MGILISCIILNAFIGVIFKLFDRYGVDNLQAIIINYFVCVITAAVIKQGNPIPSDLINQPWFYPAIGLGFVFILVFNLIALTVQNFGVVIATIFQKMSLIAPTLVAIGIYHEASGLYKWLGIISSLLAIVLLSYQKNQNITTSTNINPLLWMFPLLTFFGSCIIDTSLFLIEKNNLAANGDITFIATLFLSAGINGLIILLFKSLNNKPNWQWKNVVGGIGLGIPNFFSIYLLVLALQQGWDGSVVFPVNNVGVLVLATIFGLFIFKEKMTVLKLSGFVLAVISIILITLA